MQKDNKLRILEAKLGEKIPVEVTLT